MCAPVNVLPVPGGPWIGTKLLSSWVAHEQISSTPPAKVPPSGPPFPSASTTKRGSSRRSIAWPTLVALPASMSSASCWSATSFAPSSKRTKCTSDVGMTPLSACSAVHFTRSSPLRVSIAASLKNAHFCSLSARIIVSPVLMSASIGCGGNENTASGRLHLLALGVELLLLPQVLQPSRPRRASPAARFRRRSTGAGRRRPPHCSPAASSRADRPSSARRCRDRTRGALRSARRVQGRPRTCRAPPDATAYQSRRCSTSQSRTARVARTSSSL